MSGRIVREVMERAPKDLTPAELLVYLVLAEEARDATRSACVPATVIAHRTRLSVRTVHNSLSILAARCLVLRQNRAQIGTTQRYVLARLSIEHRDAVSRTPGVTTSLTPGITTGAVDNVPAQRKSLTVVTESLTKSVKEVTPGVRPTRTTTVNTPALRSVETNQVSAL